MPTASNLFNFLAQRFAASYDILGCANLTNLPDPISVTTDPTGVATSATINLPVYTNCRRSMAAYQAQDDAANAADTAAAAATE